MKELLIEEIKKLVMIEPNESLEINPNYLEYFQEEELIEIRDKLQMKKNNSSELSNEYLDEIYKKAKKDII